MPLDIGRAFIGGTGSLCGSYLTNPIYTAILIVVIISIILIWHYWNYCKVTSHFSVIVYIFATTAILLIAHSEAIKATYEEKYKNKASAELITSITNQREHELMSNLIAPRRANITPQLGLTGMHQQLPISGDGNNLSPVSPV